MGGRTKEQLAKEVVILKKRITDLESTIADFCTESNTPTKNAGRNALETLRNSENRLANLLDDSPAILYSCTVEGKQLNPTFVSSNIKRLLGYSAGECIHHQEWWPDHIHPDDRKKTIKAFQLLFEKESLRHQYRFMHKDGRYIWVEDALKMFHDRKTHHSYVVGMWLDITERKRVEDELKNSQEQLRQLAVHLQSAREEERTGIAREFHDELGQVLTALRMDLSWLENKLPEGDETLHRKVRSMANLTNSTIQIVKKISSDLRPGLLDDLGLVPAVEWQMEEFRKRANIQCELIIEPEEFLLDEERATSIFRILQEALTNTARHSGATRLRVLLKKNSESIVLKVIDNGKGLSNQHIRSPRSFGLTGMRERCYSLGGEIRISGSQGRGTTIEVKIPLSPERGHND